MMTYNEIRFRSHCGRLELYARDYPGGTGVPAVCLHGLTRNSADFDALARHLAEHRRVIAVDVRGRGRSEWDSEAINYAPHVYALDLQKLIATLKLPRVVLVGTSMGGLIAMIVAATMPSLVTAIILNDVGPEVDPVGIARIRDYVGNASVPRDWVEAMAIARDTNAHALPGLDNAAWDAFARRLYPALSNGLPGVAYDPAIAQGLVVQPEGATADLWPVWDAIADIPTLSIRGALSDILTTIIVRRMASRHRQFSRVTVPDRGHAPLLDETEAVTAIDGFLLEL